MTAEFTYLHLQYKRTDNRNRKIDKSDQYLVLN
jgi:hypothetical protein